MIQTNCLKAMAKSLSILRADSFIIWIRIISCDMQHITHWFSVIYCKNKTYRRREVDSALLCCAVLCFAIHTQKMRVCCWCFHYIIVRFISFNSVHGKIEYASNDILSILYNLYWIHFAEWNLIVVRSLTLSLNGQFSVVAFVKLNAFHVCSIATILAIIARFD